MLSGSPMADVDPVILTVTDNTTHDFKENSVPVVNEESVVDTEHAAQHTENAEPPQDLDEANEDFTPVEPAILPCPAQESTASMSDEPAPSASDLAVAAEETPQIWIKNSTTPLVVKPAAVNAPYCPTQVTACLSTPAKAAVDKAWASSTLLKKRKADDEPLVLAQEAKKKKEKNPKAPIITDLDAMAAQLRGVDHVELRKALTAVGVPLDVEWCDMTKAEYEKEESFVKEKDQPDW
jgi:hypothetical protein